MVQPENRDTHHHIADDPPDQPHDHRGTQLLNGIVEATQLLIDREISEDTVQSSIEILRKAARADRIYIQVTGWEPLSPDARLFTFCAEEGAGKHTPELLPRWCQILSEPAYIHTEVASLPALEAATLAADGVEVQRVLAFPIVTTGIVRGYIRFDRITTAEGWKPPEIAVLQIAAHEYASALAHFEALANLRESEARFRRLIENAPDLIYRMNLPDGAYEYVSPSAKEILGLEPQEMLEHNMMIREILHPGWRGYFEAAWEKLLRGEAPPTYEYAIIHRETQQTRWLFQRNTIVRDPDDRIIAIEGIVSDITARKHAELQSQSQQSMLESVFRAAPIGILLLSARVILHLNDKVCDISGYTREELIGRSIRMLYPTEEDYNYVGSIGYKAIQKAGFGSLETRWQRKDGIIINVQLNAAPIDPQDLAAGVTVTVLEIAS